MSDADCTPGREPRSVAASFCKKIKSLVCCQHNASSCNYIIQVVLQYSYKHNIHAHVGNTTTRSIVAQSSQQPTLSAKPAFYSDVMHQIHPQLSRNLSTAFVSTNWQHCNVTQSTVAHRASQIRLYQFTAWEAALTRSRRHGLHQGDAQKTIQFGKR